MVPLYFAKDGRRYRSLGCVPCTFSLASQADSIETIREELRTTKTSERSVRAQDQESEEAFERLRRDGYM
jgi:sulfate adenylyltransferase subunit 2